MKKTLIILSIFLLPVFVKAQKCKYEESGYDQFTKQLVKRTKLKTIWSGWNMSLMVQGIKIDAKLSIAFRVGFSGSKKRPDWNIKKGDKAYILFESGDMIELRANESRECDRKTSLGVPPVKSIWIIPTYEISEVDLGKIMKEQVKAIRIIYAEGQEKTKFDQEITKKQLSKFRDIVTCIL